MRTRLKVAEIARSKGFNQSTLSRAANVDFKTVKRIYKDPYRDVNTSTLIKIALALGVCVDDLVEISD